MTLRYLRFLGYSLSPSQTHMLLRGCVHLFCLDFFSEATVSPRSASFIIRKKQKKTRKNKTGHCQLNFLPHLNGMRLIALPSPPPLLPLTSFLNSAMLSTFPCLALFTAHPSPSPLTPRYTTPYAPSPTTESESNPFVATSTSANVTLRTKRDSISRSKSLRRSTGGGWGV